MSSNVRALKPNGTYVTVGGSIPRLLQTLFLSPVISRLHRKPLRIVGLKPNKDLAQMNKLFEDGKLLPVMEGPFDFSELPEALRLFGAADHKGKIIVRVA